MFVQVLYSFVSGRPKALVGCAKSQDQVEAGKTSHKLERNSEPAMCRSVEKNTDVGLDNTVYSNKIISLIHSVLH